MLELIAALPAGARVLDLGAAAGSFDDRRNDLLIVRVDLDPPLKRAGGSYVAADAARLPFAPNSFDLVVSNHSLEHFPAPETALEEAARVLKKGGALFVAVPDASTLTDRIYRWMARGGGHVNAFRSPGEVIRLVERCTGLRHRATRTLYSSLSFLNRHNFTAKPPRKIALFAGGDETFLGVFAWTLRALDRRFGTRLSQYGWSFYFGAVDLTATLEAWPNVCVRCGSGHSEDYLHKVGAIRPLPGVFDRYLCPDCGGANRFTRTDE